MREMGSRVCMSSMVGHPRTCTDYRVKGQHHATAPAAYTGPACCVNRFLSAEI